MIQEGQLIKRCPVGCPNGLLLASPLVLPEGPLRICSECGQVVSGCTEETFASSMQEFNVPEGTWPAPEDSPRLDRKVEKILARAERLSGKSRRDLRLLDIGCSSGAFIAAAARKGVSATGVEPAPKAAAAAQKAGLNVYQGFLEEIEFGDAKFDLVTILEVIEHLAEPAALLKKCRSLLKHDGLLIVSTGNTRSWTFFQLKQEWHYLNISKHGGHVSFYNPASIELLAARNDLKLKKICTYGVSLQRDRESSSASRLLKGVSELMNMPAKVTGFGEEMMLFFSKN